MSWASGRCVCEAVRYELSGPPMIVHACHCRHCQRISGSPFVVNLWIEACRVQLTGELQHRELPTGSGRGQEAHACASCGGILYTRYLASPGDSWFVRGATLDDPSLAPPDVYIYTRSKPSWLHLPDGVRTFEGFYNLKETWSADSLARLNDNTSGAKAGAPS